MILPPVAETRTLTPEEEKLERDLSQCVRCAVCLPSCPTYQLTLDEGHSPRGRISLVRAMHEGIARPARGMDNYLGACLECRACETACPNNVEFHKVIEHGHHQLAGIETGTRAGRFFKWLFLKKIFSSSRALDRFMLLLRLYQKSGMQWLMRKTRLLKILPWNLGSLESMFPAGLGRHRPARKQDGYLMIPAGEIRGTVNLFTGCIADHWLQSSAHAVMRTLLRLGYQVRVPAGQQCCGALHAHLGDTDGCNSLALENIQAFADNDDPVILHAAGCGAMLKEYPHRFAWSENEEQASAFAGRIVDFTQLLARDQQLLDYDQKLGRSITWDDPCHMIHAQGIASEPRSILKDLPGAEYRELDEASWCCGSAGVYNVVHHNWSKEILSRKLDHLERTGADLLITANPGCYLQLRSGIQQRSLKMEVLHIAEAVDACFSSEPALSSHSAAPPWR